MGWYLPTVPGLEKQGYHGKSQDWLWWLWPHSDGSIPSKGVAHQLSTVHQPWGFSVLPVTPGGVIVKLSYW
jgi:hypothetical protein